MDSRVGKYQILEELGRGGMGVVYLAFEPDLQRKVALKVLQPNLAEDAGFVQRFEEEARAVATLFHPNILPINALSRQDGRLVIEMPHVECGSLANLLDRQGLYCPDIAGICVDTLEALAVCHAKGIIHRDVKPSNILLDPQGRALLGDFGLAKAAGLQLAAALKEETATSMFVGTPRYAPLEAWDGGNVAPAWDLYSVGVILYEGLSGRRIIEADSILGHLHALEQGACPRLREIRETISPEMSDLVASCVAPAPEDRPESAAAALDALKAAPECKEGRKSLEATWAGAKPLRPHLRGQGKRRKVGWVLLGGALALVLLAAGAALIYSTFPQGPPSLPESDLRTEDSVGVRAEPLSGVAVLLARPRVLPPDTSQTYLVTAANGQATADEYAVLTRTEGAEVMEGLLFGALRFSSLLLSALDDDQVAVSGRWGGFMDRSALRTMEGTLTGTGRWLLEGAVLAVSLTFSAPTSGLRWEEHLTLTQSQQTDTEILWRFEAGDYLMPLLTNELLPRNAAWSTLLDTWCPAIQDARLMLVSAQEETYAVDGRAEELFWGDADAIRAFPEREDGRLMGAIVEEGALLCLRVSTPMPASWSLQISLQTEYAVPQQASRRFQASYASGRWVEGFHHRRGGGEKWSPSWPVAESAEAGAWSVELLIPFASTTVNGVRPEDLPWRANISVFDDAQKTEGPLLFWGTPDTEETQHGVMLCLDGASEQGD